MSDALKLREEHRALTRKIRELTKQQEDLQKLLQSVCIHPMVTEVDYESNWANTYPPRRICEVCGFEEEGWGCGYKTLTNERVRTAKSRHEFYSLRGLDFDLKP